MGLPSLQNVQDMLIQVFPDGHLKVFKKEIPAYELYLEITLGVHIEGAVMSLEVLMHYRSGQLLPKATIWLESLHSDLLFDEDLNLSTPSDLIGGLSYARQVYEEYHDECMDELIPDIYG